MAEHITKKQSSYSCDVLIIGCGSAGLRAAIEAHDAGVSVLIVSTSKIGDLSTVYTAILIAINLTVYMYIR